MSAAGALNTAPPSAPNVQVTAPASSSAAPTSQDSLLPGNDVRVNLQSAAAGAGTGAAAGGTGAKLAAPSAAGSMLANRLAANAANKVATQWAGKKRMSQLANDYWTQELHRIAMEQAKPKKVCTPGRIACGVITFLVIAAAVVIPSVILTRPAATAEVKPTPSPSPTPRPIAEVLVFVDDFNGGALDRTKWNVEVSASGGGNWEFQVYTARPENLYVSGGMMHIRPTLTESFGINVTGRVLNLTSPNCGSLLGESLGCCTDSAKVAAQFFGCARDPNAMTTEVEGPAQRVGVVNPVASARINTKNKYWFQYGRVEVRARMPRGRWLWPAIWMLPVNETYGQWPASGEIDIAESYGNPRTDNEQVGVQTAVSTLHWGAPWTGVGSSTSQYLRTQASKLIDSPNDFATDFLVYGLYWDATGVRMYYKSTETGTENIIYQFSHPAGGYYNYGKSNPPWPAGFNDIWGGVRGAPFDQPFYLVINLAVGGTMGYWDAFSTKPWKNDGLAMKSFYDAKNDWWNEWSGFGTRSEFQVDWVKVYELRAQK